MPRSARLKSGECVYHIMVKSVGGTMLFDDDYDKMRYLKYIKKYKDTFFFNVYGYCLMDNHAHIIIDAAGADISDIMHGINQSYAQYYNRRHARGGHLFSDRFKSKIVHKDRYLIALSGYIHNNPSDLPGYQEKVENYPFSSLGVLLGIAKDNFGVLDSGFLLRLFGKDTAKGRINYLNYVKTCNKEKLKTSIEFKDEKAEYRDERKIIARNIKPEKVVDMISESLNKDCSDVIIKHVKRARELKALCAFVMRGFCDMTQREICNFLGNITQSYASQLCNEGYSLVSENGEHKRVFREFIEKLTG